MGAPPTGIAVERLPVEKDDTDTGAALKRGWRLGYRAFALYGCGGGRVDHLLANLQCLARLSALGATARLAARDYDAYAVTARCAFPCALRGRWSACFATARPRVA